MHANARFRLRIDKGAEIAVGPGKAALLNGCFVAKASGRARPRTAIRPFGDL